MDKIRKRFGKHAIRAGLTLTENRIGS
jgi:hypothetical protein